MKRDEKVVFGVSMAAVRNVNEKKVLAFMEELIPQFPDFDYCTICLQDVYALSLNRLTPRYTQSGTVVLKKELVDDDYRDVVEAAIECVTKNVNHPV